MSPSTHEILLTTIMYDLFTLAYIAIKFRQITRIKNKKHYHTLETKRYSVKLQTLSFSKAAEMINESRSWPEDGPSSYLDNTKISLPFILSSHEKVLRNIGQITCVKYIDTKLLNKEIYF